MSAALGALLVLTSIVVIPGAQAFTVSQPEPIPATPLVAVTVTFDDPDLVSLDELILHFECTASLFFSETIAVEVGSLSGGQGHAILLEIQDSTTEGYGYQQAGQTGYGYFQGAGSGFAGNGYTAGGHGYSTGVTDVVVGDGYNGGYGNGGYGYGYGNGYGYGYDSGSLTFIFLMVEAAFIADEECILAVEVVPHGNPPGDFESPASLPFTPRVSPTADAGVDLVVPMGASVQLDGSLSIDGNDSPEPLAFLWDLVDDGGLTILLDDATLDQPTFLAPIVTADVVLTFRLTVDDGLDSDTDTVSVRISFVNSAPLANAGPDDDATEGRIYTLDGTASSDPDDNPLTFFWTQLPGGPLLELDDATSATPRFLAPEVDQETPVTFELLVSDGLLTDTDEVTLALIGQLPPTVQAPADDTVTEGATFVLAATAHDRNKDPLTYSWIQIAGPRGIFSNPNLLQPLFTPPEVDNQASVTLRITVSDGFATASDEVTYLVRDNEAPIAEAGAAVALAIGATVTLDGSASYDPDGDNLQFLWSVLAGDVALTDPDTAQPIVTANANAIVGSATLLLTVRDPSGAIGRDTVEVVILPAAPLKAKAGPDQGVSEGTSVTLRGDASTGPIVAWTWLAVTPGAPTLTPVGQTDVTFQAPAVTTPYVDFTYQLTVRDAANNQDSDTVVVRVYDGAAITPPQEWFLHTADCIVDLVDVGTAIPAPVNTILPPATNTATTTDSDGDSECLHPAAPLVNAGTLTFAATPATRDLASGSTVTGDLYIALLLEPELEAPLDGVRIDIALAKGATVLGSQQVRSFTQPLFGIDPAGLPGAVTTLPNLPFTFTKVPFTFTTTGALGAGESFSLQVRVPPTVGLVYVIGLEGAAASSFIFPGFGAQAGAPTANAGVDQSVNEDAAVTLDGTQSQAVTGTVAEYRWEQLSGLPVTLTDANTAHPRFTAPDVVAESNLRFRLTVKDSQGLTSIPDDVRVTVRNVVPVNLAPIVAAGLDVQVGKGTTVTLTPTSTDTATDYLSGRWTQISGEPVGGTVIGGVQRVFVAPEVTQTTQVVFRWTVRDNHGAISTDDVVVTIKAQFNAGPPNVIPTPVPVPTTPTPTTPTPTTPTPGTPQEPGTPDVDTDGDGTPDHIEILLGSNPNDANDRPSFDISITLEVRRENGQNVLEWPDFAVAIGFQVWSSNSPYVLAATLDDNVNSYTDPVGKETTKYKLTYFVERSLGGGFLSDAGQLAKLPGWDEELRTTSQDAPSQSREGLPNWVWVSIALELLAGAIVVAVVVLRRKK